MTPEQQVDAAKKLFWQSGNRDDAISAAEQYKEAAAYYYGEFSEHCAKIRHIVDGELSKRFPTVRQHLEQPAPSDQAPEAACAPATSSGEEAEGN